MNNAVYRWLNGGNVSWRNVIPVHVSTRRSIGAHFLFIVLYIMNFFGTVDFYCLTRNQIFPPAIPGRFHYWIEKYYTRKFNFAKKIC